MFWSSVEGDVAPAPLAPVEAYQSAVSLLRGTFANHVLCCSAMICSLCLTVAGYIIMTDGDSCGRTLTLMAVCYIVSQSFTVAKVSRDRLMAGSREEDKQSELDFLRPTPQYVVQVLCFFALACLIFAYAVTLLDINSEWFAFVALVFIWLLVSILCLTKSIRDRKDASTFGAVAVARQPGKLRRVIEISIGTLEYRILVRSAFAVSVLFTLIWIWKADIVVERKGFLSLALIFNVSAGFHMAKLLRDLKDQEKARELRSQTAFIFMVVASFVISLLVPVVGICVMPLEIEQRLFLLVGQLMTSNTCLNLAKMVRDMIEQKKLLKRLPISEDIEAPAEAAKVVVHSLPDPPEAEDGSIPVVMGTTVECP